MTFIKAVKSHWPEYLIEAWGLGMFMISACFFTVLLEHPASPIRTAIEEPVLRRFMIGVAMALTFLSIARSKWGSRSGAHLNPAVTWTFYRLGKVQFRDALFYTVAQFGGGAAGVALVAVIVRQYLEHPAVHYAATVPGPAGALVAFLAEIIISFFMMLIVLLASNHPKLTGFTPIFAGILIATYITFEAPFSGMSMNAARTVSSALGAADWTSIWIYFAAPLIGMFAAAETYVRTRGAHQVYCAKLFHLTKERCIFFCNFPNIGSASKAPTTSNLNERRKKFMVRKTLFLVLAFSVFGLYVQADHATLFKIRIENVSSENILVSESGQTAPAGLSPGLIAIANGKATPLFTPGKMVNGSGIERLAEDGNPEPLANNLRKEKGFTTIQIFNTPTGKQEPGPIGPGGSYELTFTAHPGDRLVFAQMFGQSNDLFYSTDPKGLELFDRNGNALHGDVTQYIMLWDAGTEVNQEPGFGADQAPRQKAPDTGAEEHGSVSSVKDMFTYPAVNRVVKVTISHQ